MIILIYFVHFKFQNSYHRMNIIFESGPVTVSPVHWFKKIYEKHYAFINCQDACQTLWKEKELTILVVPASPYPLCDHPGVLAAHMSPGCVWAWPVSTTPGCLVIVALSPHYYSGDQRSHGPDNPTLPTSGAPGLGKCSHQRNIQTFILAQKYLTGC